MSDISIYKKYSEKFLKLLGSEIKRPLISYVNEENHIEVILEWSVNGKKVAVVSFDDETGDYGYCLRDFEKNHFIPGQVNANIKDGKIPLDLYIQLITYF